MRGIVTRDAHLGCRLHVRADFADSLRCPRCRARRPFALAVDAEDAAEVRAGTLTCGECGLEAGIADGIVDLMHDPPPFVTREAAGLERFAQRMRDDGWTREDVLALPARHDGYWWVQDTMMLQVLESNAFAPGETILDLGANTCWASAIFAQHGLAPTALDIATTEMQGLKTADWQMQAKGIFMERVLAVMYDLPFADGSFDNVWASQVLHHNGRRELARTMREIFRVLKPGGRLIVGHEPLRTLRDPQLNPGHEVAEFEGHEHVYMRWGYTLPARRAGFDVDVRGSHYRGLSADKEIGLSTNMNDAQILRAAFGAMVRRRPWLLRVALASRAYVRGGTGLHMVCTKPVR